jgi:hypothetical protein
MHGNNAKDRTTLLIRIVATTTLCKGLGMKKLPDNNLL